VSPTETAPMPTEDVAVLGELYARDKALALSIGAALTLGRRPTVARAEVERHLADCERAVAERPGALAEHFAACREDAANLAGLVREAEGDRRRPSQRRLRNLREGHRRLRRLVWQVLDCEYAPCGHERAC
jgi:hypothetical protein